MSLSRELKDEGSNSARVRALSDGVFAIVLTFLIFRLDIAKLSDAGSDREIINAIKEQAAPLLGYILSFFIIGGFWMMHQRVFRHLSKFNRELYWLNLQFLFFLSILPLTTSIHSGNHELRIGWWLYAGNVTVAGLGLLGLWLRASRDSLLDSTVDHVVQAFYIWRLATIPLVFLVSILVSFQNVIVAQWVPLAVPLVSWVVHKFFERRADSNVIHLDIAA
ncbi:MAG: TMEM175 family protein [Armatimonadota bacterium]